jgi:hypothetical protein
MAEAQVIEATIDCGSSFLVTLELRDPDDAANVSSNFGRGESKDFGFENSPAPVIDIMSAPWRKKIARFQYLSTSAL